MQSLLRIKPFGRPRFLNMATLGAELRSTAGSICLVSGAVKTKNGKAACQGQGLVLHLRRLAQPALMLRSLQLSRKSNSSTSKLKQHNNATYKSRGLAGSQYLDGARDAARIDVASGRHNAIRRVSETA